jgi:outer membrane protein TolC
MKYTLPIFLLSVLLFNMPVFSQKGEVIKKVEKPTTKLKLSIKEAIQRAIEFSPEVKNTSFELVKTDSGFLKSESKYSWKIIGGVDSQKSALPDNQLNFFTGTKTSTDKISGGIEKVFNTGTYFKTEISSTRFDSNAFEDQFRNIGSGFSGLALPPLYTGAVTLTLSQDILKNTFGVQDRNFQKILKNQSEIGKLDLSFKLSTVIVDTLVTYWASIISESAVKTYEQLLKNTKEVRDLTKQKANLGLAENFEINQWNALYSQTENQLQKAKLEHDENRRKLIRILNLPPDSEFGEMSDLRTDLPSEINYERDLEYAFLHRNDWKGMAYKKEIALLTRENARDNALPSVKLTASRSAKAQTIISPQYNFTNNDNGVPSTKYYDATANLKISYPLGDKGIKAELRDAEILNAQVKIQEDDMFKEITDDVRNKYEQVVVGHKILENAELTTKQSEAYYKGIYNSFRLGRFNAVAVKNALDTYTQNQLQEIQAKINYNINLMRYDLAKNALLERFEINVEKIVPEY